MIFKVNIDKLFGELEEKIIEERKNIEEQKELEEKQEQDEKLEYEKEDKSLKSPGDAKETQEVHEPTSKEN